MTKRSTNLFCIITAIIVTAVILYRDYHVSPVQKELDEIKKRYRAEFSCQ